MDKHLMATQLIQPQVRLLMVVRVELLAVLVQDGTAAAAAVQATLVAVVEQEEEMLKVQEEVVLLGHMLQCRRFPMCQILTQVTVE